VPPVAVHRLKVRDVLAAVTCAVIVCWLPMALT